MIGVKKGAIFTLIYFFESICLYYIPQAMPQAMPQTHFPFHPHRLIVWIRQKLSKHQSYHKVKRAKRSVIWMHKKCTFYVQNSVSKGKKCFKPGEIAVHWWTSLNMTIWKQPALASYREVPKKTEPESKLTKKFYKIGHFRVPKSLTFKMRLGAQPFLWKWVLFAWEWKMISISKGWAPTLVLTQRPGGTRNWPLRRRFLRSNAVVSRSCFELMLWMNNSSKKIDREVIYWKFLPYLFE